MDNRRLRIYLNDHLASAQLGIELTARMRKENQERELRNFLSNLEKELRSNRDILVRLMRTLGIKRNFLKQGAAWLGEKAGRLKMNGSIVSYSPLSRLEELEGLMTALGHNSLLWSTLEETLENNPQIAGFDFSVYKAAAHKRQEALEEFRPQVAREAFSRAA